MENHLIYYKNFIYKYPPLNVDPARLVTICLLHILRSMWVAIFPQKATTTVSLGFFIKPSSMIEIIVGSYNTRFFWARLHICGGGSLLKYSE